MNLHRSFLLLVACGLFVRVSAADSDVDDADVDRRILESLKLAPDPDEYYQHLAAWNETDFDEWLENEVRLFASPSDFFAQRNAVNLYFLSRIKTLLSTEDGSYQSSTTRITTLTLMDEH